MRLPRACRGAGTSTSPAGAAAGSTCAGAASCSPRRVAAATARDSSATVWIWCSPSVATAGTPASSSAAASSVSMSESKPRSAESWLRCVTSPRGRRETLQLVHHPLPLHLPGGGLRQLLVREVPRLDALRERQRGRDLADVLVEQAAHLGAVALLPGGDEQHGHALAVRVGEADDRQLLHEVVRPVELLDLVRVDVLPVGVDDDVLLAADEREAPLLVEPAEVAGVEPAALEDAAGEPAVDLGRAGARLPVAEHDVRPARQHLAHAGRVGLVDPELDPGERLAHRAGRRA